MQLLELAVATLGLVLGVVWLVTRAFPQFVVSGTFVVLVALKLSAGTPDDRSFWLFMVGALALIFFVIMPLFFLSQYSYPALLRDDVPDGRAAALLNDARFLASCGELTAMGFEAVGDLFRWGRTRECAAFRYFRSRDGTVLAYVVHHVSGRIAWGLISESGGRLVATTNWTSFSAWNPPSGEVTYYHPRCRDASELLWLHAVHMNDHAVVDPVRFGAADVLPRAKRRYADIMEAACAQGCLRPSAAAGYWLTYGCLLRSLVLTQFHQYRKAQHRQGI